jgi:adenylate cyclase, class 2
MVDRFAKACPCELLIILGKSCDSMFVLTPSVFQYPKASRSTAYTRFYMPSPPNLKSGHEVEIKLFIRDIAAVRAKLVAAGAKFRRRVHEHNTLFDTPSSSLRESGQLLRIRIETPVSESRKPNGRQRGILTSKAPTAAALAEWRKSKDKSATARKAAAKAKKPRYKVRIERECTLPQPQKFRSQLESLGFRPRFIYEKYRTTYSLPGVHAELDETPSGTFLELEGSPAAIESAARALGFTHADYSTETYWSIYVADCQRRGVTPTNMLFR